MIKGKLVTVQAIELQCGRCGRFWIFRGSNRTRANCPTCKTSVSFQLEKSVQKGKADQTNPQNQLQTQATQTDTNHPLERIKEVNRS